MASDLPNIAVFNRQQIIDYVRAQGRYVLRRDIARAFQIKVQYKRDLKDLLNQLADEKIFKRKGKSYCFIAADIQKTVKIIEIDKNDQVTGELIDQQPNGLSGSHIINGPPNFHASLRVGDHVLVDIQNGPESHRRWKFVRKLTDQPSRTFGFVKMIEHQDYSFEPTDRKLPGACPLNCDDIPTIQDGHFIEAQVYKNSRGQLMARAVKVLDNPQQNVQHLSFIAIHKYDLPQTFSEDALLLADKCQLPSIKGRVDLRDLPLVTIDDQDARDHDDAVFCAPMDNGSWRLIVAIADVSHFVHPGDALDQEALARGNSVYFPDQVLPMLPEQLSNNLCSLKPKVDRPCLVADMVINAQGHLDNFKFYTAIMRSHAKLTYTGVQTVMDGDASQLPKNLSSAVIENLNQVYQLLKTARQKRGTLDFDLPEKKVILDDHGVVQSVTPRLRHEVNQLIEEMMIIANVAAARFLSAQSMPLLYRIHDQPRPERLEDLRRYLDTTAVSMPKGQTLKPKNFMSILNKVHDLPQGPAIHELILRAQSQAQYSPNNMGHFGLNLPLYCHFTSPIRRYADLIVHRAIKAKIANNMTFFPYTLDYLDGVGEDISNKERRAAKAERDTVERYIARHLDNRIGETMVVQVKSFTPFAIFVTHTETGCDGILPLRNIMGDYFTYDAQNQSVIGRRTKVIFRLGDLIHAVLQSANWITGNIVFAYNVIGKRKIGPGKRRKRR